MHGARIRGGLLEFYAARSGDGGAWGQGVGRGWGTSPPGPLSIGDGEGVQSLVSAATAPMRIAP